MSIGNVIIKLAFIALSDAGAARDKLEAQRTKEQGTKKTLKLAEEKAKAAKGGDVKVSAQAADQHRLANAVENKKKAAAAEADTGTGKFDPAAALAEMRRERLEREEKKKLEEEKSKAGESTSKAEGASKVAELAAGIAAMKGPAALVELEPKTTFGASQIGFFVGSGVTFVVLYFRHGSNAGQEFLLTA